MNKFTGIGRLTKDPELKYTSKETMIASFAIAIDRTYSKTKEADFLNCKAFGKTAELIGQYLSKGALVGIAGSVQTGSYDAKDGTKRYYTEIIVNEVKFLDTKKEEPANLEEFSDLGDIPF